MRKMGAALVLWALSLLACSAVAQASHPRPGSASPLSFRIVPAFENCTAPSGTHGPPLTLPSCTPPVQSSDYLTVTAPDRPAPYNMAVDGTGLVQMKVTCTNNDPVPVENGDAPPCVANPGDQQNVVIRVNLYGIRCVGTPGQGGCPGGAGSSYYGKVEVEWTWRITDHENTTSGPGCGVTITCVATVVDFPFDIGVNCANGFCGLVTGADTFIPNFIKEDKRAVVELGAMKVNDAGANGQLVGAPPPTSGVCPPACSQDDPFTLAFVQGLFAP